jgi:Flp pilus assembly secretin CpaC
VEHLHRAAEHLEAAGAEEMAREVREEADALLQASVEQLNQKREQVARLLREIAELEGVTGSNQQIMLRCQVLDVDAETLRQLGLSFVALQKRFTSVDASNVFPRGAAQMEGFIEALAREGLVKVLAEPVLITTNGRPANLHSGGEFPVLVPDGPDEMRIEFREFGLRLEAVPTVLTDGRVRLDIAPELSRRDFENAVTLNGTLVPGLQTRRINTQVEMEFGETVTLLMPAPGEVETVRQASAEQGADDDAQTVTVICITPERVRRMHGHPVAEPPPAPVRIPETPAY